MRSVRVAHSGIPETVGVRLTVATGAVVAVRRGAGTVLEVSGSRVAVGRGRVMIGVTVSSRNTRGVG